MSEFFDHNRRTLEALFVALGKAEDWLEDPAEIAAHTLPRWLGSEHGPGITKEVFTEQQISVARPLLRDLGLTGRVDPPQRAYDEILVMGAAGIGLHRRVALVVDSGVAADRMTILAGLRPHSGHPRDGGLQELVVGEGHFAGREGWQLPQGVAHVADLLRRADVDDLTAAQVVFPDETALAELAVAKHWPRATRVGMAPPVAAHLPVNELGQRDHLMTTWDAGGGPIPVLRILNGAPVERDHGPSRPTSRSTLAEWLDVAGEEAVGASLLVVVNQPHLDRVAVVLRDLMAELGRGDVRMDFAGCETLPDTSIHLLLGELPARLLAERR